MPPERNWKVYFAFSIQITITLVSFILAIVLLAKKGDIEAREMRFAVRGLATAPYWIPLLAFGYFLHAGLSAGASVALFKMVRWVGILLGVSWGFGCLMFAMLILLTTFLGWIPAFLVLLVSVAIPPAFFGLVFKELKQP